MEFEQTLYSYDSTYVFTESDDKTIEEIVCTECDQGLYRYTFTMEKDDDNFVKTNVTTVACVPDCKTINY